MSKDRTAAFRAAAKEYGTINQSESKVPINLNQGSLDAFFKEVEDLTDKIDFMDQNVNLIDKKQSIILKDSSLVEKLKKEIEEIKPEVNSLSRGIKKRLNSMNHNIELDEKKDGVSANTRIRRIQYERLTQKFVDIFVAYNSIQADHREKLKQRIIGQLRITGKKLTDKEIEDMLESGKSPLFTEISQKKEKVEKTVKDAKQIKGEILKLEKSVRDLHEMVDDMEIVEEVLIVKDQSGMVNHIEFQVRNAPEYVENIKQVPK